MKVLFYLGHPAHFYLFKNVIRNLQALGHQVTILIKKKDVLEDLLRNEGMVYRNILPEGRRNTMVGIGVGVVKRDIRLFLHCLSGKPDLMVGTSVEISHVGKLLGIPSIVVNEDDAGVVPLFSKLSYPWASCILSPGVCMNGKWEPKTIKYPGYHELGYLHPNHFTSDKSIAARYLDPDEPYFIIRFAQLTAHHDSNINGIGAEIARRIVEILEPHGRIYITSERELEPEFMQYRLNINPLDIHHLMAFARIFVGDSQTMAAESGVLGIPFVRVNDFVGRIGYLRELEDVYQLGYGINPKNVENLYKTIRELIEMPDRARIFQERRFKMLSEKIDSTDFFVWFIENYPESKRIVRENPGYPNNFR